MGSVRHSTRAWSAVDALIVICFGLASRRYAGFLPQFMGKYPGDVLWGTMMFFAWRFLLPRMAALRLSGFAFAACCAVESSQLYHAPWIDALRGNGFGHLILGSVFAWGDIAAYGTGIGLGVLSERLLFGRAPQTERPGK
jgi:hypothetical protein